MKSNSDNSELKSSLKSFDFKGWTSDKIIDKYEQILFCREKQIEDLSMEFGNVYKENSKQFDLLSTIQAELLQAKKRSQKLVKFIKNKIYF